MNQILPRAFLVLFLACSSGGCAAAGSPLTGALYTDVKVGLGPTASDVGFIQVGTAKAVSYLGLVAVGDASIETAMRNGGLTKIHHVDHRTTSILGLYATYEVLVYGE